MSVRDFGLSRGKRYRNIYKQRSYGDCGLFEETDIAKEMGMIDVNVRAVHFLTKKLLRQMRVKDRGFILNVASSAGLIPAGSVHGCLLCL